MRAGYEKKGVPKRRGLRHFNWSGQTVAGRARVQRMMIDRRLSLPRKAGLFKTAQFMAARRGGWPGQKQGVGTYPDRQFLEGRIKSAGLARLFGSAWVHICHYRLFWGLYNRKVRKYREWPDLKKQPI
jgi:hypothetical protein